MHPLIPIIFSLLTVVPHPDCPDDAIRAAEDGTYVLTATDEAADTVPNRAFRQDILIQLTGNEPIEAVEAVECISVDSLRFNIYDVIGANGGSRRLVALCSGDTLSDLIDGGGWGTEGMLDNLYVTDRRGDTMSAVITVSDASPSFTEAPEGGVLVELTDRIVLTIINFDSAEKDSFVICDNQVVYKADMDGVFRLQSIRPRPDDLRGLARAFLFYDLNKSSDNPLTDTELLRTLRSVFPVPGRVTARSN